MHRTDQQPKALQDCPRCGARTRKGTDCRSPVVNGKSRCRMHGGAAGSGAPAGARNGSYRHGNETHQARAERREVNAWVRVVRDALKEI